MGNRRVVNALLGIAHVAEHAASACRWMAGSNGTRPDETRDLSEIHSARIAEAFAELDTAVDGLEAATAHPKGIL